MIAPGQLLRVTEDLLAFATSAGDSTTIVKGELMTVLAIVEVAPTGPYKVTLLCGGCIVRMYMFYFFGVDVIK